MHVWKHESKVKQFPDNKTLSVPETCVSFMFITRAAAQARPSMYRRCSLDRRPRASIPHSITPVSTGFIEGGAIPQHGAFSGTSPGLEIKGCTGASGRVTPRALRGAETERLRRNEREPLHGHEAVA